MSAAMNPAHPPSRPGRASAPRLRLAVLLGLGVLACLLLVRWQPEPPAPAPPAEVPRDYLTLREGRLYRAAQSAPFFGLMLERHPDGALKSRSAISNGVLHGVSEGWHTNRTIQVREHFVAGVSHGPRLKWHANGRPQSTAEISEGKLHGTFRRWNEDGTLAEQLELKAGVPDGTANAYYPSGRLKTSVRLQNGKSMEQTSWPDGERPQSGVAETPTSP